MKMENFLKKLHWNSIVYLTVAHDNDVITTTVTFLMVDGEKLVQPVITKEDDELLTRAIYSHHYGLDNAGFDHTGVWVDYSRYPNG